MNIKFIYIISMLAIGIFIGILSTHLYELQKWKGAKSMNAPTHSISELEYKIWSNGDTAAYRELEVNALDEAPNKFLFWALYMANKYDYTNAYWDVYFSIEETYAYKVGDSALYKIDDKTRQFALSYLKQAAQKGDASAVEALDEMKKKNVPDEWLK